MPLSLQGNRRTSIPAVWAETLRETPNYLFKTFLNFGLDFWIYI